MDILNKYREIAYVLFVEDETNPVNCEKIKRRIEVSIKLIECVLEDTPTCDVHDLYEILDTMSTTLRHCLYQKPRSYDHDAATMVISMLNATKEIFDTEEMISMKALVDKEAMMEILDQRMDCIIELFNHEGPFDDQFMTDLGYKLGTSLVEILSKSFKERHTIRESIDISHRREDH